jgi:hypothetical protein
VQIVFGASGEHEACGPGMRCLGGGRHALGRRPDVIDGLVLITGEILHRAARQPGFAGEGDGPRDTVRIVGEAALQIGGDRKYACRDDRRGMRQGLIAAHRAIQAAQRRGEPGTRRGECLETQ